MKWRRKKDSGNVIDLRGAEGSGGGRSRISLPGGMPGGMAGLGGGLGTIVAIVLIAIQIFGGGGSSGGGGFQLPGGFDIGDILTPGATAPGAGSPDPIPPEEDPQRDLKDFSVYVFEDSQEVWAGTFQKSSQKYEDAQLVLYSSAVSTEGCGNATSAVGPFYCPADSRVYLDLTFYEDMQRQLGAGGDFAWAYVIAHEMGHHIQNVTGTNAKVSSLEREDPSSKNELSVRTELQADCYAGVWGATVFASGDLEDGDLDEAFNAAEAIGDDRLQEQAGQEVNPDSFTHGTSEQRKTWFKRGYESGDPSACDTFSPDSV